MGISVIVKKIKSLDGRYRFDQLFYDWVKIMAISLANQNRFHDNNSKYSMEYFELFEKYGAEYFAVFSECFAELIHIFETQEINDYLGRIYHELGMHNVNKGQFFTPYALSREIAVCAIDEEMLATSNNKKIKVLESACGAGAMVLAQVEHIKSNNGNLKNFEFTCCDIDINVLMMCYVQMSLAGANAICVLGDSLKNEVLEIWETPSRILRM